jgi:hypothetical protein
MREVTRIGKGDGMFLKFRYLIFEDDCFVEELTAVHEFANVVECARVLASFAARQSGIRVNPRVIPLYSTKNILSLPPRTRGYGPNTWVVIKDVSQATPDDLIF